MRWNIFCWFYQHRYILEAATSALFIVNVVIAFYPVILAIHDRVNMDLTISYTDMKANYSMHSEIIPGRAYYDDQASGGKSHCKIVILEEFRIIDGFSIVGCEVDQTYSKEAINPTNHQPTSAIKHGADVSVVCKYNGVYKTVRVKKYLCLTTSIKSLVVNSIVVCAITTEISDLYLIRLSALKVDKIHFSADIEIFYADFYSLIFAQNLLEANLRIMFVSTHKLHLNHYLITSDKRKFGDIYFLLQAIFMPEITGAIKISLHSIKCDNSLVRSERPMITLDDLED